MEYLKKVDESHLFLELPEDQFLCVEIDDLSLDQILWLIQNDMGDVMENTINGKRMFKPNRKGIKLFKNAISEGRESN